MSLSFVAPSSFPHHRTPTQLLTLDNRNLRPMPSTPAILFAAIESTARGHPTLVQIQAAFGARNSWQARRQTFRPAVAAYSSREIFPMRMQAHEEDGIVIKFNTSSHASLNGVGEPMTTSKRRCAPPLRDITRLSPRMAS
ncbi:Nn.00g037070.m01.CDS01 [Neocucurbitaria sp. VM-36]